MSVTAPTLASQMWVEAGYKAYAAAGTHGDSSWKPEVFIEAADSPDHTLVSFSLPGLFDTWAEANASAEQWIARHVAHELGSRNA